MNLYNPNTKCPKCGCTGIRNKYWEKGVYKGHKGGMYTHPEDGIQYVEPYCSPVDISHIARECFNCGYTWDELPLDSK